MTPLLRKRFQRYDTCEKASIQGAKERLQISRRAAMMCDNHVRDLGLLEMGLCECHEFKMHEQWL